MGPCGAGGHSSTRSGEAAGECHSLSFTLGLGTRCIFVTQPSPPCPPSRSLWGPFGVCTLTERTQTSRRSLWGPCPGGGESEDFRGGSCL